MSLIKTSGGENTGKKGGLVKIDTGERVFKADGDTGGTSGPGAVVSGIGGAVKGAAGRAAENSYGSGRKTLGSRLKNIATGAALNTAAGYMGAARVLNDAGVGGGIAALTDEVKSALENAYNAKESYLAKLTETGDSRSSRAAETSFNYAKQYLKAAADATGDSTLYSRLEKQLDSGKNLNEITREIDSAGLSRKINDRTSGIIDEARARSAAEIESAKEGLGPVGRTFVDAGVAGTQMALDAPLNLFAPGASLAGMGTRAFGNAAQDAKSRGADTARQIIYGGATAGVEVLSEKLFDGLAGLYGKGMADETTRRVISKLAKSEGGQRALGILASAAEEGAEEVFSGIVDPAIEKLTFGGPWSDYYNSDTVSDLLHDAVVGGLLGGFGGTVGAVRDAAAYRRGAPDMGEAVSAQITAEDAGGGRTAFAENTIDGASESLSNGPLDPLARVIINSQKNSASGTETELTSPGNMARYSREIDGVFDGSLPEVSIVTLGNTPTVLLNAGANPRLLTMTQNTARKIAYPNGYLGGGHNLGMSALKQLPYAISDPAAILSSKTQPNSFVILTEWNDTNGNRVVVPIHLDKQGEISLENRVASAYGKENLDALFDGADVLYTKNGKDINDLRAGGLQLPASPEDDILARNSIPQNGGNINENDGKYILPEIIFGEGYRNAEGYGGRDGLGAAEAGGVNSEYGNLQGQSAVFHDPGPGAVRHTDVPAADFDGRNIPKSASTIYGAQGTPDSAVIQLEKDIASGRLSFDTITDTEAVNRARRTIDEKKFSGALEQYRNAVDSGAATKDNTALGQQLLLQAMRAGDGEAVSELLGLYTRNSTNAAQALQAQSIFRKLSPEGQLVGLQKAVDALNAKYGTDYRIDGRDAADYINAESESRREEVEKRIVKKASEVIPGTFRAKFDTIRYLAMLGNPRTHIRNILGNTVFQIPVSVKNRVGAVLELGANKLSGGRIERTKSLTGANPAGKLARAAFDDFENVEGFLTRRSKFGEGQAGLSDIERQADAFSNGNVVGRAVNRAAEANSRALEAEDTFAKRFIYAQSLAGYLKANGVKNFEDADAGLLGRARIYAAEEALRNTFNDTNNLSRAVSGLGDLTKSENPVTRAFGYITEGFLPFKKTPANILMRAFEYSPAGAVSGAYQTVKGVRQSDAEAAVKGLDRLAAGLTGTGLLALGAAAAGLGIVRGGGDDDENRRRFDDLTGHQPYSIELPGGTSVTLDWLAPEAIPFFMGVELYNSALDGGVSIGDLTDALKNASEPMLEMSMLQGLSDTFDNAAYAANRDESVLGAVVASALTNYVSQAFPTLFGQLERISENERMTTYKDKDSGFSGDMQYTLGKISQKIPGWDYNQIPYIDVWGRTEESGDVLARIIANSINPAYVSQVDVDRVERLLQEVADETGDTGVFPERAAQSVDVNGGTRNLRKEEYVKYAKELGQTRYGYMRQAADNENFGSISAEDKARIIKELNGYSAYKAKMMFGGALDDTTYNKYRKVEKAGVDLVDWLIVTADMDVNGNNRISQAEAGAALDKTDFSEDQKYVLWNIINRSWTTNPYR